PSLTAAWRWCSSTSQTVRSLQAVLMDLTCPMPMPPVPMTARVRTSLGGVNPAPPRTCRGTIVSVVSEAMEVFRKPRRLNWWRLFMGCLLSCFTHVLGPRTHPNDHFQKGNWERCRGNLVH